MPAKRHYDYVIVGAGLFGMVFARQMTDAGKTCLVLEKRSHIGGNIYTRREEGIDVHVYGAHIFHTDIQRVWDYVNRYAEMLPFINSPVANYHGELYNLPFNMNTFSRMWGVITPAQAKAKIEAQRSESGEGEPQNLEEQAIRLVGRDIYEKLIKGYTEKQWGRPCDALPASIIRRLPVRFTFDNNYFTSRYQAIPQGGYTALAERLLDGIEVLTDTDYLKDRAAFDAIADRVIFTGPVDSFFDYSLGALAYRSVRFETETLDCENWQGVAVMNYTDRETPFTRIIEHKHFARGAQPKTIISREYSEEWKPGVEPYYPVRDAANTALYDRYATLAAQEPKVRFGGRLGVYRYFDMDQVIASALEMADSELAPRT